METQHENSSVPIKLMQRQGFPSLSAGLTKQTLFQLLSDVQVSGNLIAMSKTYNCFDAGFCIP